MSGFKGATMNNLIIEYLEDDCDSGLEWIVWNIETNLSPSGWLETKADAEEFIKNYREKIKA
jgi:hypothetical protein